VPLTLVTLDVPGVRHSGGEVDMGAPRETPARSSPARPRYPGEGSRGGERVAPKGARDVMVAEATGEVPGKGTPSGAARGGSRGGEGAHGHDAGVMGTEPRRRSPRRAAGLCASVTCSRSASLAAALLPPNDASKPAGWGDPTGFRVPGGEGAPG